MIWPLAHGYYHADTKTRRRLAGMVPSHVFADLEFIAWCAGHGYAPIAYVIGYA